MIAPNSELTKLDPKEELNARERKLLKVVLSCDGNEAEASRTKALNCSHQNVSKRMRLIEKKVGFARLMDYCELADIQLIGTLREGLKATKPISCNVYVKDKTTGKDIGEMIEAGEATKDFVDIEDHPTRHKFLTTALKIKKHIDSDDKSGINQTFNINFGHRQPVKTVDV